MRLPFKSLLVLEPDRFQVPQVLADGWPIVVQEVEEHNRVIQ